MRLQTQNGVGTIVLDNPPANTFDHADLQRFASLIEQARYQDELHAMVISSAPGRFFSAGADIRAFQAATPRQRAMISLLGHEVLRKIEHTPMVFVAAIAGHASGGGLELAMACDLRFAADGDYTLGLPEAKLGLLPGMGGTQRLPRLVGLPTALDMITTGRTLTPNEAHHAGLVDRLYSNPEGCHAAAIDYCAALAAGPAEAIGRAKTTTRLGLGAPLETGLALEQHAIAHLFTTHDATEGITAFTDKRPPHFLGR